MQQRRYLIIKRQCVWMLEEAHITRSTKMLQQSISGQPDKTHLPQSRAEQAASLQSAVTHPVSSHAAQHSFQALYQGCPAEASHQRLAVSLSAVTGLQSPAAPGPCFRCFATSHRTLHGAEHTPEAPKMHGKEGKMLQRRLNGLYLCPARCGQEAKEVSTPAVLNRRRRVGQAPGESP